LPSPPDHWKRDFPANAQEAGISTTDHPAASSMLESFWNDNSLDGP
jgi:hypothetical protein